jgi:hypothetical protein
VPHDEFHNLNKPLINSHREGSAARHRLLARLIRDTGSQTRRFANSADTKAANMWRKSSLSQSTILPSSSFGWSNSCF